MIANPSSLAVITDFRGNGLLKYLKKECNFRVVSYFKLFGMLVVTPFDYIRKMAVITDFRRNGLLKYLKKECNFIF